MGISKDTARLLETLEELRALLRELAVDDAFEELIHHIHQPGWTTPAESILTVSIAETMLAQTRVLEGLKSGLTAGAKEIVGAPAAAV